MHRLQGLISDGGCERDDALHHPARANPHPQAALVLLGAAVREAGMHYMTYHTEPIKNHHHQVLQLFSEHHGPRACIFINQHI